MRAKFPRVWGSIKGAASTTETFRRISNWETIRNQIVTNSREHSFWEAKEKKFVKIFVRSTRPRDLSSVHKFRPLV